VDPLAGGRRHRAHRVNMFGGFAVTQRMLDMFRK
jgi:NAD/NADP transhydrogenase alpha subunit